MFFASAPWPVLLFFQPCVFPQQIDVLTACGDVPVAHAWHNPLLLKAMFPFGAGVGGIHLPECHALYVIAPCEIGAAVVARLLAMFSLAVDV